MTTALYRKNGGEVIKISPTNQPFTEINAIYYGVLTDPAFPNGMETVDAEGAFRVLGFAKFADVGGDSVRNAIQAELDNYPVAQAEDENLQDATGAKDFLNTHPRWRKLLKGLAKVLIREILEESNVRTNEMIDQWNQFKSDVASVANLGQLKSAVAALPTINSDLTQTATLVQFLNSIKNEISEND